MHAWVSSAPARRLTCSLLGTALFAAASSRAQAAVISGVVIGEGARRIGGALVEVVKPASGTPCETRSADDGTFKLPCDASGVPTVRASFEGLRPWEIADVELAADREVYLNFVL